VGLVDEVDAVDRVLFSFHNIMQHILVLSTLAPKPTNAVLLFLLLPIFLTRNSNDDKQEAKLSLG